MSRKKAILARQLDVVGDTSIVVPAGRFETYIVTERFMNDAAPDSNVTTWYVMKSVPRLVACLEAALPNGGTATVELQACQSLVTRHRLPTKAAIACPPCRS